MEADGQWVKGGLWMDDALDAEVKDALYFARRREGDATRCFVLAADLPARGKRWLGDVIIRSRLELHPDMHRAELRKNRHCSFVLRAAASYCS